MTVEIFERPPLFDLIDRTFGIAGKPVIFAWGDIIYNPMRIQLTPALKAHEATHARRQNKWLGGPEQWWHDYCSSKAFRLDEEIRAHCVEYRMLIGRNSNRAGRRRALAQTAKRLASPLYGGFISTANARKVLLGAA